jgi:hypothetical protein
MWCRSCCSSCSYDDPPARRTVLGCRPTALRRHSRWWRVCHRCVKPLARPALPDPATARPGCNAHTADPAARFGAMTLPRAPRPSPQVGRCPAPRCAHSQLLNAFAPGRLDRVLQAQALPVRGFRQRAPRGFVRHAGRRHGRHRRNRSRPPYRPGVGKDTSRTRGHRRPATGALRWPLAVPKPRRR